jgi:hypothetical protein
MDALVRKCICMDDAYMANSSTSLLKAPVVTFYEKNIVSVLDVCVELNRKGRWLPSLH